MTEDPQLSGIDGPSRTARRQGGGTEERRRPYGAAEATHDPGGPRDGREPMGLGAAIGALVTERPTPTRSPRPPHRGR